MNFSGILLDTSIFIGLYFQVFLLVTFFEAEEPQKKLSNAAGKLPTVSITVPCFNEARTLEKTVASLLGLNYPKEKLSILIVDDGSTDDTSAVARKIVARLTSISSSQPLPYNIRAVRQENGGKYTALNRGIAESTADLVGCLDADSMVDPEALMRMVPHFVDLKVMAVTPALLVHQPKTLFQYIQRVEYNIGVFTKRVLGRMNAIHVTPGPFSIFRRAVFTEIGPFKHAHNTEDMEIAFRIQSFGYKITNCYNAVVYTITPRTLRTLYRQRTRWSYGFIKNAIDYKHIFFNKKYGNIAVLTLPFAVIGIFFALYVMADFLYHVGTFISEQFIKIQTVGIHMPHFAFSWFFVNTQMTTILALILIGITLTITLIGRKIAEGNARPSFDILYFMALYGLIAPLWLGKAVFNTILSRTTPWR
jgi:cellulose synthase/poly-beta-1,6-N-acetylglucosamine synthase-like glycosyltransferase